MNNTLYPPEGLLSDSNHPYTLPFLKGAMEQGDILEGKVVRCDTQRRLIVDLDGWTGIIPEAECVAPFISGAGKGIALLSCVGRTVSFLVTSMVISPKGDTCFMLSRRRAQEKIMQQLCTDCLPGSVLPARVTHLDSFGAFVDIGGGVISMIPLAAISVARIRHPAERFTPGQKILTVAERIDPVQKRIYLTHKELLGTWLENASLFEVGETVSGIVRGSKDYGIFVELTPNLSGLADYREPLPPGTQVAVHIKSIQSERMKVKLQIIQTLDSVTAPPPLHYQITDGRIQRWCYSPPDYAKDSVVTDFTAP